LQKQKEREIKYRVLFVLLFFYKLS